MAGLALNVSVPDVSTTQMPAFRISSRTQSPSGKDGYRNVTEGHTRLKPPNMADSVIFPNPFPIKKLGIVTFE